MSIFSDINNVTGLGRRRRHRRRPVGLGRRRVHHRHGRGFFGDVWNGIKSIAPAAHNLIKNTGLVSKGLSFIPGVGGIASTAAKALGYGRRRRRVHRVGGGIRSGLLSLMKRMEGHGRRRRRVHRRPVGLGRRHRRKRVGGLLPVHKKILLHHLLKAAAGRHRRRRGGNMLLCKLR